MKKLYLKNGFFNFESVAGLDTVFNFIVGGRGTGKTYGALEWAIKSGKKFLFMRRLQKEADIISRNDLSPFRVYSTELTGCPILCAPVAKYVTGVYKSVQDEEEPETWKPSGAPIGLVCALSSIANMRGFDTSDIDVIIFDEFIPEKSSNKQRYLGDALLNAYETINRNRELAGRDPVRLYALANSNDLSNDIFIALGLVNVIDRMTRKHQELYINKERGISVIMLSKSKISEAKKQTALYRLTAGSEFARMSLDNDFSYEDRVNIKSQPIREYNPLFTWGGICIYKHKSKSQYYVTLHISGTPAVFDGDVGRRECRRVNAYLWHEYFAGRVYFESFDALRIFRKLYA